MIRRLSAAIAGLLLTALWASPALAMTDTRITAPGSGPVSGTTTIRVSSTPDGGILGSEEITVRVTITPPAGAGSAETITLAPKGSGVFEAPWDTDKYAINGAFKLDAVASSSSLLGNKSENATSTANVANPPNAPTGVKAALKDGVPHVTWAANKEPDVLGYKVLRSVDGGTAAHVSTGPATSFTDSSAPHSKPLTYRVVAVRKAGSGAVDSSPSAPTAAVTVAAPPPPAEPGAPGQPPADPSKPVVPGTNIVTGKEAPKAPPLLSPNKNFGKAVAPIVKAAPGGPEFDETLPYSGVPPEQFDTASGGEPAPIDAAGADDGTTVANPIRFILGGILLGVASFFMWRYSRKLLRSTQVQDPKLPQVKYPVFRINRG
ncbi:MAG TPA: hypothetical protein VHJ78_05025 [Actinomycetota bacterium]|nr:hypothetical protein [Actinomycetota bacterium]